MSEVTKFEVGKTYKAKNYYDRITVSKRTEKTIWFCDNYFSARIKIKEGIETISPEIGIIRMTYYANEG